MCRVSLAGTRPDCRVVVPLWQASVVLQLGACNVRQELHLLFTLLLPILIDKPSHNAAHNAEH